MGLADREILQLYTQGEGRYAQNPPVELLNNLLYYAARATSNGPKVTAVRASFRLNELLIVDDSVEQERENLSAPSVKLMRTVAAAIREDLGKVKDVLDIYVRRGGQPAELESQVGMLRKIGDTLGVLGLGELRQLVIEETGRLEAMAAGKTPADHAALVHIAATLINVEDRLDRELIGLIVPKAQAENSDEVHRRRFPAGAGRGAARMQRQPGARQGGDRLQCRRHAGRRRARFLAGPDRRHQGRTDDARQDARRRNRRWHRSEPQGPAAAGRLGRSA